jgi:hypothetical protein
VIRTSVDHGTAFDIAGTGKAGPAQHGRGTASRSDARWPRVGLSGGETDEAGR